MNENTDNWTLEKLRRKRDQEWDMAGLARQDGDREDEARHTAKGARVSTHHLGASRIMTKFAIFDLDNCLSNDEWRIQHIRFELDDKLDEKWDRYHSLCAGDNPGNTPHLRDARARGLQIAFVTMRPREYRELTIKWIKTRLALGEDEFNLIMRADGDHRPSVELKRCAALAVGVSAVAEAYDDRADIVAMYRSLGIPSAHVLRIHNVSVHRPPPATADDDANPARPAPEHPDEGRGGEEMPLAPPTRGEGCARGHSPPRPIPEPAPMAGFPFTTDPLASFDRTTGRRLIRPWPWPEPPPEAPGDLGLTEAKAEALAKHLPPLPAQPARERRADDFLEEAMEMWREKNAAYGDNYRRFGELAVRLFPAGLRVETEADWNRLAVFIWVLTKVSRYAECMPMRGHADSALDLTVYAAMLRELTPS